MGNKVWIIAFRWFPHACVRPSFATGDWFSVVCSVVSAFAGELRSFLMCWQEERCALHIKDEVMGCSLVGREIFI